MFKIIMFVFMGLLIPSLSMGSREDMTDKLMDNYGPNPRDAIEVRVVITGDGCSGEVIGQTSYSLANSFLHISGFKLGGADWILVLDMDSNTYKDGLCSLVVKGVLNRAISGDKISRFKDAPYVLGYIYDYGFRSPYIVDKSDVIGVSVKLVSDIMIRIIRKIKDSDTRRKKISVEGSSKNGKPPE